ncbi:MAG TPA: hypothetical protein VM692_10055 [Gammaproteobacteria bacterium]|nr:hypothetical protein [Gammaproteobacteria bacterium]
MSAPSVPGSDVDALFKLPLDEFTSARNALAAQLKRDGKQTEASEAKALVKPSVSAWVVNQLYWRHRESFDRLIEAGDRLRHVQGAQLTSDSARDAMNARREAVTALAARAADLLSDGQSAATRDLLRRVTSTLEALSSYGSLPGAPAAGRLTDDVEPPGFEALAGLVPSRAVARTQPSRASSSTKPAPRADARETVRRRKDAERKQQLAAAKATVRQAEGALRAARKQAERAAANLDSAATRANDVEQQRAELEVQLARAAKEAKAARERADEAAANASEAAAAAEGAERALEGALRRLQQLSD